MMARIRKSAEEKGQGGFTLIELLVVMIIIGILAAVAIPVFLSQRAKARDTAVKADVSTIGKEIATFWVDAPAGSTQASVAKSADGKTWLVNGVSVGNVSNGVELQATNPVVGTNDHNWCVGLTHADGDKKNFKYSAAGGLEQGVCAAVAP